MSIFAEYLYNDADEFLEDLTSWFTGGYVFIDEVKRRTPASGEPNKKLMLSVIEPGTSPRRIILLTGLDQRFVLIQKLKEKEFKVRNGVARFLAPTVK